MRTVAIVLAHASALLSLASLTPSCSCGEPLATIPGGASGRLCDVESGRGLAGAEMRIAANGGVFQQTFATLDDGAWHFDEVPLGPATVTTSVDDRQFDVVIRSRETAIVEDTACRDIPFDTGDVSGQFCEGGEFVAQALVVIAPVDAPPLETFTDDVGAFALFGVPVGPQIVRLQSALVERRFEIDVVAGETSVLDFGGGCDLPPELLPDQPAPADDPDDDDIDDPVSDGGDAADNPDSPPDEEPVPDEPPPPVCPQGTVRECYSGPIETIFVGECAPGTQTCDANGNFGACTGEVLPTFDEPENGIDEDCDGFDASCFDVEIPTNILLFGDCISASCPFDAPFPTGCAVFFTPGDDRGCVAHDPGTSSVYFQAGDECNAGFVTGTLFCSAFPQCIPGSLNSLNCPINKPVQIFGDDPGDCPDTSD